MISIIIPVLNEEKSIATLLENLKDLEGNKEIIIVDGGSCDNTVNIAKEYGLIVEGSRGRARQMNAGAKIAKGDILWFVHSDSILDLGSLVHIKKVIEEGYIGGSFKLYFYDLDTRFMRYVACSSNRRAKYLKLIFGDQGLFIKKDIFQQLDGYKDMELMEDWDMSKRVHNLGKMKTLDIRIGTSARRFEKGGQVKTLLFMHKIKLLYLLGIPPDRLSKIYRQVR